MNVGTIAIVISIPDELDERFGDDARSASDSIFQDVRSLVRDAVRARMGSLDASITVNIDIRKNVSTVTKVNP